ncbi:MAG: hypothetical protein RSF67_02735, partial [Clostridia bacterium]
MNYDIELYKKQIFEEEKQRQELVYNKYIDVIPQSTALTTNGRAIPLDLLQTDKSVLLYCYLQLESNWNDDETHRYVWREYYKIRPLLDNLKGKYSKLSSTATVTKKLKELISSEFINEQSNALVLKNSYFENLNYALISQETLTSLISFKDELLIRVYIWYIWLFYRNKGNAFICFDETLFNHINYSYQSKNKLRLKDIRTVLLKNGFIEMASMTRIDHTTGLLK